MMVFLSGCNCCGGGGGGPCNCQCKTGKFPNEITVTFDGPQGEQFKVDHPVYLEFSSTFGSGAEGTADAPGGDNTGPISNPKITKSGSGYAKFGRVEPNLTVSGGGGSGATFEPTLSASEYEGGFAYWFVSSISISGGTGYEEGDALTITASEGDTVVVPAGAKIGRERQPPAQENPFALTGGTGDPATASVWWTQNDEPSWRIDYISLESGGSGYLAEPQDFESRTFGKVLVALQLEDEDDVSEEAAELYGYMSRVAPTVSFTKMDSGEFGGTSGTGAVISLSLGEQGEDFFGYPVWGFTATIINGGSGYVEFTDYALFDITAPGGAFLTGGSSFLRVTGVDSNGSITSLGSGPGVYGWDGVLGAIEISNGGKYYHRGPFGVEVFDGGEYYRESPSVAPYVSEVTVAVRGGRGGSGAQVDAVVEDDTSKAKFGQIRELVLVSGGNGYSAWHIESCDCEWVEGESFGATYESPAFNFPRSVDPLGGCRRHGYLCYKHPFPTPNAYDDNGGLLGIRIYGDGFDVECPGVLHANWGIPGWDGGPVVGLAPDPFDSGPCFGVVNNGGHARPGRGVVQPNRFSFDGQEYPLLSASMAAEQAGTFAPYWSVSSVSVAAGLTVAGIYDGAPVSIYSNAHEGGAGTDYTGLDINDPGRSVAQGTAVVSGGELTGITVTDGGVFYNEYHSTPNPDPKIVDETRPAIVRPVNVGVIQLPPSDGTGAIIKAIVIDDTRDGDDFGNLTFQIESGGNGYLGGVSGEKKFRVQYCGPRLRPYFDAFFGCQATYIGDRLIENCNSFNFNAVVQEFEVNVSSAKVTGPTFQGSQKCCARTNCEQFFLPGTCRFPREITASVTIGGDYTDPVTGNPASISEEIESVVLSTGAFVYQPFAGPVCAAWLFPVTLLASGWHFQCTVSITSGENGFYAEASALLFKDFSIPTFPFSRRITFGETATDVANTIFAQDENRVATPGAGSYCPEELDGMEFDIGDGTVTITEVG